MGYNQSDKDLVLRNLGDVKSVLDYGSQVDYSVPLADKPLYISEWYKSMGIEYTSYDLAGDNNSIKVNLAYELPFPINIDQFDLTVDCGCKEHYCQAESYPVTSFHNGEINSVYPAGETDPLQGFYWGWRNQFNSTKEQGKMISVNPRSAHWENHGYTFLTVAFYERLQEVADIRIIELYEDAACNNWETGMNVVAVLRKIGTKFPTFEEFSLLPIYNA